MINFSVVFIVFTVLQSYNGAFGEEEDELVFIRDMDSTTKRSIDPLPDLIPLKVSTKESNFHLMLTRNKHLDNIPFLLVDGEDEKQLQLDEKSHGFYHDVTKNAVIQVELVEHEGVMKRKYTGSLIHGYKAYELHPVEINDRLERELQERAEDITGIHLHVLRYADISKLITDTEITERLRRSPDIVVKDNNNNNGQGSNGNSNGNSNDNDKSKQVDTELPEQNRPNIPDIGNSNTQKSKKEKLAAELEELLKELREKENNKVEDRRKKRETSGKNNRKANRNKRSTSFPEVSSRIDQNYKVEVVFLLDNTIYDYWYNKFGQNQNDAVEFIAKLFKHILNGIVMTYNRISYEKSGITITPVLKRIQLNVRATGFCANYKYTWDGKIDGTDGIQNALYENERKQSKNHWTNVDHMMVWTMHKIMEGNQPSFGFSPVCGVCDPMFGYSLVQFTGYHSWITGAHEFGHSIGANHDGVSNNCPQGTYIMSPNELIIEGGKVMLPFMLSPCSINAIKLCLSGHKNRVGKTCLFDDPCNGEKVSLTDVKEVPGTWISLDRQCFLFGHISNDVKYDGAGPGTCNPEGLASICGSLKCKLNGRCTQPHAEFKALPGTPCGRRKWCMWGQCVSKDITQYYDKSKFCRVSKKKRSISNFASPPKGCVDGNSKCEQYAIEYPSEIFKTEAFKKACKATSVKYGLHWDFQNPCVSTGLEDVICRDNPHVAIHYTKLCDGNNDCPNKEDEDQKFCDDMSVRLPFCDDYKKVHCPNDFTKCIDPQAGCDGQKQCNGDKNNDERQSWCDRLPKQTCGPGKQNCDKNPSRCC